MFSGELLERAVTRGGEEVRAEGGVDVPAGAFRPECGEEILDDVVRGGGAEVRGHERAERFVVASEERLEGADVALLGAREELDIGSGRQRVKVARCTGVRTFAACRCTSTSTSFLTTGTSRQS